MKATRIIFIFIFLVLPVISGCSIFLPEKYGYVAADAKHARIDGKPVVIPKNAPSVLNGFSPMQNRVTLDQADSGHNAIDIIATIGTPVIAPAKGRVILSLYEPFYGHTLIIAHGKGPNGLFINTRYVHLNKRLVQKGEFVTRGQPIGELGRTGLQAGGIPHLHFETLGAKSLNQRNYNPLNPHTFWYDGPGIITCFKDNKTWDDSSFKTTYPVVCK